MKVLHVAHSIASSYGGPTQSLNGYVAAGRAAGARVTIVAPELTETESPGIDIHAGDVHQFRAGGRNAFRASPALVKWLRENARAYDVVHVHGLFNPVSSLGARTCINARVPTVIRPFGTLSRYTFTHRRQLLKRAWFTLLERQNLERASGIHFTTEAERDEASWHGIDFANRAHVVPPPFIGCEPIAMKPAREKIVLFLSRLHPVKNLESLIEAWSIVSSKRQDWTLVIAGSGSPAYTSSIRALAESTANPGSIEFAGFLTGDEKKRMLERAGLFVLPSRHENFGVAVLEAVSSGLACVVSPEVQLAPFLTSHQVGRISIPEPDALASSILHALDDQQLRDRAEAIGPSLVREYFGIEAICHRLMQMYEAAIDRSAVKLIPHID